MSKTIIGITGPIAAGKGTVAAYYKERHGAVTFRFSTVLTQIVALLGLPNDRDHLSRLSLILRTEFGEDVLARALVAAVEKSGAPLIIVDGVRRPDDVKLLNAMEGFRLMYIDAPIETRFARMKIRGEKVDDADKTMEQFVEDHKLETELLISSLKQNARIVVDNGGSQEELYAQLEQVLRP